MRRLTLALGVTVAGTGCLSAQQAELHCNFSGPPESLAKRASPLDSVTIRIGDGEAKLCYGRPSTRGRVMVGGTDPFGQPWRMGANEPTTLHLGFAATVGGIALEPAAYSIYAIPTEKEWTIVINGNTERWGIPIDEKVRAADVGEFKVTPTPLDEPVEQLTFSFQRTGSQGGDLVYAWEKRTFRIPIRRR